ncbi:hypothetical protein Tco_0169708 [Tanacetum coccineum]
MNLIKTALNDSQYGIPNLPQTHLLQKQTDKRGDKASGTNLVNTISIPVSTASPNERLSLSDTTNTQEDHSEIPPLEDIHEASASR